MNKKILLCFAFALLVSTVAINVAQPPNLPGVSSSGVSSTGVSSSGQPPETSGKLAAGEPPAIPTDYSAGAAPKEKSMQFAEGTFAGALYNYNPGLVLESWDATTQTWTQNPIRQVCENNLWWYRITNPVKQNVWFYFGNGPWVPNKPTPMLAGTYIRSLKLNPGWNLIIAWGSESAYSNPIWCYYDCPPVIPRLTITITNPGKQGPAPKTVTIKYKVNLPCTVRLMVNMPDGPNIDSGPMALTAGTQTWTYDDPGPTRTTTGKPFAGYREVVGYAWTSDDSNADKQEYNVD